MERRRFARKQGSRRRVGSIASALPRKIACILLLATLFVHQAASQETPETTPEPEGTPAPAKKGAKCFEADYTYPMDVNVTDCRGKTFKIHRCADTQAEADLFARNLKIEGLSDDGCREFYDYYCTKTIIGGSTANPTAPCDYYCDQNFNPEVSDCDADTDCGGNTPPPFTPSPCCQGYELVCYNVSKNALNAWRVNSACVWRRCIVFDAASGIKAGIVAPLLAAITSLVLAACR